jgi:hypothetical protein
LSSDKEYPKVDKGKGSFEEVILSELALARFRKIDRVFFLLD